MTDFCSLFNLTATEKAICETLQNPINEIIGIIEPKVPILTTNLEQIIKTNTSKIFIYDTIFQQLPWLIMFIVIIIMLGFAGVFTIGVIIILIIVTLGVSALFMYFYVKFNQNNVKNMINDINAQVSTNITNFKQAIFTVPTSPSPQPPTS